MNWEKCVNGFGDNIEDGKPRCGAHYGARLELPQIAYPYRRGIGSGAALRSRQERALASEFAPSC